VFVNGPVPHTHFGSYRIYHYNPVLQEPVIIIIDFKPGKKNKLECGPIPNLMIALPNIGGTLCSTPQSLADAHY